VSLGFCAEVLARLQTGRMSVGRLVSLEWDTEGTQTDEAGDSRLVLEVADKV
jgi:hypothetical protein